MLQKAMIRKLFCPMSMRCRNKKIVNQSYVQNLSVPMGYKISRTNICTETKFELH